MNGEIALLFVILILLFTLNISIKYLDEKIEDMLMIYKYIYVVSAIILLKRLNINLVIIFIILLLIHYAGKSIKITNESIKELIIKISVISSYIVYPLYYLIHLIFKNKKQEEDKVVEEQIEENEFNTTTVKEIMTPRTSIFALNMEDSIGEHLDEIVEQGFSRIPVYDGSVDNIKGILYIKDILTSKNDMKIKELARQAVYVPETKTIEKMLEEFKAKQSHMAVIIDEYGGTSGIITIEDILEEIVGEIRDEYDSEVDNIIKLSDNIYEVMGETSVEEVDEELEIDIPLSEEYDTISGFVQYKLGKVAVDNDQINEEKYIIKVIEVENKKIVKLKIILLDVGGSKE